MVDKARDLTLVVAASYDNVTLARATVRGAQAVGDAKCVIVDVDDCYVPLGDEDVLSLTDLVHRLGVSAEASTAAATLEPDELVFYAGVLGASWALADGAGRVLVLGAGVLVLEDPAVLARGSAGPVVVPFTDAASVAHRADSAPVHVRRSWTTGLLHFEASGSGPLYSRALYVLTTSEEAALLRDLASSWRVAAVALDTFAVATDAHVAAGTPPLLVGPWRAIGETSMIDGHLCVGGAPVAAVDLSAFDAHRPWTLDSEAKTSPRVLLSEHPSLAQLTRAEGRARLADEGALGLPDPVDLEELERPVRVRLDETLRTEARRAERAKGVLPDLLGPGAEAALRSWSLELVPEGATMPVARYLGAIHNARADLQQVFRGVPGPDTKGLANWALQHGVPEAQFDVDLLGAAATRTLDAQAVASEQAKGPREEGVNLVGYLAGELGLGESARLMDDALQSAGIGTSTYDVSRDLESRRGARYRRSEPIMRNTSLICVNGAETAHVAPQMKALLKRTRVIGMWYWELEDFPKAHQNGFKYVDEVWAATDFIRDAIAKHAGDIPVRTVTPPLPQAGEDPGVVPERFGLPEDRPWFLFTFDFLSLATRKNPYGLVEAFTRAFADRPATERPLLVIKSINADRYPAHAERLRFQIADREDVRFIDAYLDNHERHVLVSHCAAYVSLHKAEGLGLTVAEAMAWSKPVITTSYGGVTQFCNAENSYLVGWTRGFVDEVAGPYEKGLPWAEPDLDQAAAFMRTVIDRPEEAAAIGARAGADIRNLHNATVAGAHMREVLEEGHAEWQSKRSAERAERRAARQLEDAARPAPAPDPAGRAAHVSRIARGAARRVRSAITDRRSSL